MSFIHTDEFTIEEAVCNGWLNTKCSVYKSTHDPAFDGGRNPTVADGYSFSSVKKFRYQSGGIVRIIFIIYIASYMQILYSGITCLSENTCIII